MVRSLLAVALLSGLVAVARADDDPAVTAAIARVRTERAALHYREALAAIDAALALGKASPTQLAELYRSVW